MTDLGNFPETGVKSADNKIAAGGWVVTYPPEVMPQESEFEVWHGSLIGPGGYALLYIDTALFSVIENGKINEYTPSIPMHVRKGQYITIHWSIATGTAPKVWLYFRTPETGQE